MKKSNTVTRDTLAAAAYHAVPKITRDDAKKIVDEMFAEIVSAIGIKEHVKLSGFGCFLLRSKSERPGRNPRTGRPAIISARTVVSFRPSWRFLETLNRKDALVSDRAKRARDDDDVDPPLEQSLDTAAVKALVAAARARSRPEFYAAKQAAMAASPSAGDIPAVREMLGDLQSTPWPPAGPDSDHDIEANPPWIELMNACLFSEILLVDLGILEEAGDEPSPPDTTSVAAAPTRDVSDDGDDVVAHDDAGRAITNADLVLESYRRPPEDAVANLLPPPDFKGNEDDWERWGLIEQIRARRRSTKRHSDLLDRSV
ncbi:integration host factor subunit alpha [Methylosinus sp. H3A]|uniref:integration host factor subunit alpha n=2 Tax=Methylosinus sp. H3A TaxID=2785786 RepID=UPI0018C2B233|nr:integration host factor subunit alpha [Methylosinus sp. H3A]MBG0812315.1 integration host factor subunit alpha [Methylosinus sp. H3A]